MGEKQHGEERGREDERKGRDTTRVTEAVTEGEVIRKVK